MGGKRLGIEQRLLVDRKVTVVLVLLALMFLATLLDFGADFWGVARNNVLALQAPLILRRISFSVVLFHLGVLTIPLGWGMAVLLLLAWIAVGYWMRKREVTAFALGVVALACDSCVPWLALAAGRDSSTWGMAWFVVLRVAVLASWIGVWRTLSTLTRQGYSLTAGG